MSQHPPPAPPALDPRGLVLLAAGQELNGRKDGATYRVPRKIAQL